MAMMTTCVMDEVVPLVCHCGFKFLTSSLYVFLSLLCFSPIVSGRCLHTRSYDFYSFLLVLRQWGVSNNIVPR